MLVLVAQELGILDRQHRAGVARHPTLDDLQQTAQGRLQHLIRTEQVAQPAIKNATEPTTAEAGFEAHRRKPRVNEDIETLLIDKLSSCADRYRRQAIRKLV